MKFINDGYKNQILDQIFASTVKEFERSSMDASNTIQKSLSSCENKWWLITYHPIFDRLNHKLKIFAKNQKLMNLETNTSNCI
ncbi:hypothetical protein HZS_5016 [Henneguya salminicola]|nr:hypothetical protein HZS_5016 [Henneguya salminicola]